MLYEVLLFLHNWFCNQTDIRPGSYTVESGYVELSFLQSGQYFRITGSTFNDGVYQYPATGLTDETFYGAVWPLKIPAALLELVEEIEAWQADYGGSAALTPYQSESFGGYSYTKASASGSSSNDGSSATTWQDMFCTRLAAWRKI